VTDLASDGTAPAVPRRRSLLVVARAGAALAAVTALALVALPTQLGGATSYALVDGSSMQPSLRRGDLVVLRQRSRYAVGDVVAYRSRMLHRLVLHRVVAIRHGRYVFKGDHNGFLDPERPARAQLVGAQALRIPFVGRLAEGLRLPLVAALVAGLAVVSAAGRGRGANVGG
jgi:signal peptidase I